MLSGSMVISFFCLYMGFLFALALWAQRRARAGKSLVNNPLIYSLSLAVYCSSWTFYGSIGLAANRGLLFLTIYLGPTLVAVFGWGLWRKLVRLKTSHRITSLADFISTRYEKSQGLAALVTLICLVGTIPYVSLQLKAVMSSFAVLTTYGGETDGFVDAHVGSILVFLMIVFTIIFGVRRLEPTERHEGMVMAVAAESLVKLVSLVLAGVFVVYGVFDGIGDIFQRAATQTTAWQHNLELSQPSTLLAWASYLIVSANAILCLPRQFHITVVENQSENHIRWAMWLFPLYLFIINIFIYPVALGGQLQGFPLSQADTFILQFPVSQGRHLMALLVFLGGFSAATSMILISSMTMAIMISNHLFLPMVDWIPKLDVSENRLLQFRWLAVTGFIVLGYFFERRVGEALRLADIGMLSFVAVLQLAPALLGGLFWRGGTKRGAYFGLTAGALVWGYTMLLPSFANAGWVTPHFLAKGPFDLHFLSPQNLFGISFMDSVTHTVFWSLTFNVGLYILGSLGKQASEEGQSQAAAFVGAMSESHMFRGSAKRQADISLKAKLTIVEDLFTRYFGLEKARDLAAKASQATGLENKTMISILELAELYSQVETFLGGAIGAAAASRALARAEFFTLTEIADLRELYAETLANLKARPEDLIRQIDFHREREVLVEKHSQELEEKILALENEIARRKEAEEQLRESEERYRLAIESSSDAVVVIQDQTIMWGNRRLAEIFGYDSKKDIVGRPLWIIVHPEDRGRVLEISRLRQSGAVVPSRYDFKGLRKNGTEIYIAVSATTINYHGETMNMAYLRDVTMRRRAEEEIRNLSQQLIEGIEEERRRLAADLHDEFGQALTGLHLSVESLKNSLPPDLNDLQDHCRKVIRMIEQLAENLRNISSELRPDMLDHLGLVPTVTWYVDDFKQRASGLEVELQAVGFRERKLKPQVEIIIYRILQEALNNVVKHSHSTKVLIRLTYSHPHIIMIINDNGRGFDLGEDLDANQSRKSGIGLISMKERVAAAGGTIDIRSVKGQGTTIRVDLPTA